VEQIVLLSSGGFRQAQRLIVAGFFLAVWAGAVSGCRLQRLHFSC
jgi:hypothetical protein